MTYVIDVLNVFLFVLLIRVVLSYIPAPPGSALLPVIRFFEAVTEPVLRPVRRIVPPLRVGGSAVDLSPIIVWFAILIIRGLL
ncbi:MAG: YggT family protein [Acidimicrobiales bacterium]|jgi:YggT family protein